ncbi:MAG: cell division protein ZapA [Proteobacteria bacterium]|nr:cell division protein ZapA [Pseudomonadota bacterium]
MSQVSVVIDGKTFRMACEDGQEAHLEALGRHLDGRIGEMRKAFGEIGDLRLVVMAAITITDEFFEARKRTDSLAGEVKAVKAEQTNVRAGVDTREVEVAQQIDRMTQRLERIIALLSTRPDL